VTILPGQVQSHCTGGIGYVDEDDNLFVTDRLKKLIKYDGSKLPPAQLEALLIGHPVVLDVAVIGVCSTQKATELPWAYIVVFHGHNSQKKIEKGIHEWVNKQVIPYKRLCRGTIFIE
jgi:4-coumarate--CoA ligase